MTAQLQEKLRTDREQIEAIDHGRAEKLAESLSRSSKAALDAIETDTIAQLRRIRDDLDGIRRRQRRWPLWTVLTCIATAGVLFVLLWLATSWARSRSEDGADRTELGARIVLDTLRDGTTGMTFQISTDGQQFRGRSRGLTRGRLQRFALHRATEGVERDGQSDDVRARALGRVRELGRQLRDLGQSLGRLRPRRLSKASEHFSEQIATLRQSADRAETP